MWELIFWVCQSPTFSVQLYQLRCWRWKENFCQEPTGVGGKGTGLMHFWTSSHTNLPPSFHLLCDYSFACVKFPLFSILPVAHVPAEKKNKSGSYCCLLQNVRKGLIFCPEGFSGFCDWVATFETGASWGKCKQWSVSPCSANQPGDMLFNCVARVPSGLISLGSVSACRRYCPCHEDQSE